MRLRGNNTMILSEEQMIFIVNHWMEQSMMVTKAKVISVKQSRKTGRFTVEIKEITKS